MASCPVIPSQLGNISHPQIQYSVTALLEQNNNVINKNNKKLNIKTGKTLKHCYQVYKDLTVADFVLLFWCRLADNLFLGSLHSKVSLIVADGQCCHSFKRRCCYATQSYDSHTTILPQHLEVLMGASNNIFLWPNWLICMPIFIQKSHLQLIICLTDHYVSVKINRTSL